MRLLGYQTQHVSTPWKPHTLHTVCEGLIRGLWCDCGVCVGVLSVQAGPLSTCVCPGPTRHDAAMEGTHTDRSDGKREGGMLTSYAVGV